MKIGILTLPLHTNYGGILQAYALQTVLERMGHEVKVIDVDRTARLKWYKAPFTISKRILNKMNGCDVPVLMERELNRRKMEAEQYTKMFVSTHIKELHVKSLDDLKEADFDAIVVGSDQIWRPKYINKFVKKGAVEQVFLSFAHEWKVKKVAYAASFGTEKWEFSKAETQRCKPYAKLFDAVSVREVTAVGLCAQHLQISAQHVLDPTMLLRSEDYINLLSETEKNETHKLVTYVLDRTDDKEACITFISKRLNAVPHELNLAGLLSNGASVQLPVENWLAGIMNAECVITDSFHACVFSILFNKPFVVLVNKERGASRFHSLLAMFKQEHRIVDGTLSEQDLPNVLSNPDCDLTRARAHSVSFLKEALK